MVLSRRQFFADSVYQTVSIATVIRPTKTLLENIVSGDAEYYVHVDVIEKPQKIIAEKRGL